VDDYGYIIDNVAEGCDAKIATTFEVALDVRFVNASHFTKARRAIFQIRATHFNPLF
jgi:hypothetical protein